VDPKVGLGAVEKRKIPSPRQESNPRTPIVQPVEISNTKKYLSKIISECSCYERANCMKIKTLQAPEKVGDTT
jgi:hypothetical protein